MTKATDLPQPPEALARWYTRYSSPVGVLYLAARADAVVGIWYEDQAHFPLPHELGELIENPGAYLREHGTAEDDTAEDEEPAGEYAAALLLSRAEAELSEYFERKRTSFTLPLDPEGTDFQLIVWEHLKTVPAGYTTTYGEISRAVGPGAPAQAVGQAVGRNKVSIMIPCHRVIGADGSLTGYAGGVERKQFLLDLEEPEEVREARLF
ncbi:methylated-DNA--[protein]-cysteine S-methyltransferase [uncultured Rothia sp.]|uniref:methylated-DNA--[protein]-cysteine S-methyltransferase n=1 Tax=uncultured Rothia sp. TaxID=316088 RepID=UPI0028DBC777|nr:methylated-DNA--[protein]-cysteine S-methyltransferase [uncultured Rothia sp.]